MRRVEGDARSDLSDSEDIKAGNELAINEKKCSDVFKEPWTKRKVGSLVINGRAYRLYWGSNTIGRSPRSSIRLESMRVSKRQAVIVATDNKMLIWPISRNSPTCLNAVVLRRKKWHRIYDLTRVSFGDLKGFVRNEKNHIARKKIRLRKKQEGMKASI